MTCYWELSSPVGPLLLIGREGVLEGIHFQAGPEPRVVPDTWVADARPFTALMRQLDEYFQGRRRVFDVTLAVSGTPFQRNVWEAVRAIPYGTSASYGAIAVRIGRPFAARAVGQANGANPWPIVVPCHRVIGTDRSLTGFGGGLGIKRGLLRLEASAMPAEAFALEGN